MRVAGQDDEQVDNESEQLEQGTDGEGESQVEGEENQGEDEDDEEVVVQIGDEEPATSEEKQAAPAWVKGLRERQKQLARENAELKAQLATGKPVQTAAPEEPKRPKLADYEFDEDKFDAALDKYETDKRAFDAHKFEAERQAKARQESVAKVHENYATSKKALKVKDFADAEDEVVAQFDQVQQSIVIAGAANPAAIVYALGKNPAKLRELSSIKDPVKFAVAVGKLETEVKVTKRASTKPAPETPLRSTSSAGGSKATLERLEAEADRTGDRTKVIAYKRQQRQSGK